MAIHHMIFIYGVLFIFFKILVFWVVRGVNIVQTPPPPHLITSPGGGESEKLKNGGGSVVQGQVFLIVGLLLFLFKFFKVYHFYI